ncbi:glycoprotease family-domain-containing protein [Armillaria novae-zelandiae]|uniref:N(6)-L-threonylcarbamoyladenine synthase n=1 Tax=Armillaria novae-zelandiae TaxID=153914 RepID=A0AA39NW55_9AGAR|nr:glycoprotease family-domain-containing protein [Armillaria novae-zelandiae]
MLPVLTRPPCRRALFLTLFKTFTVLAFESSANDTCAAVITSDRQILSNVVIRQHHLNEKWGRAHPAAAVMEHQTNMPVAAKRALAEANLNMSGIDRIAFTRDQVWPVRHSRTRFTLYSTGMGIYLSVACNAAKTLAAVMGKPLVGVHHMQAHTLTPRLTSWPGIPTFPFLSLLISGGHTLLLLANSVNSFQILATTQDESIRCTFDKVTRELGLGWAGPSLERFCNEHIESRTPWDFPPSVERFVHRRGGVENIAPEEKVTIARAFQEAIVDHLESKLMLGIKQFFRDNIPIKHVIISSGVASNSYPPARLTRMLSNPPVNGGLTLQYPPPSLCTGMPNPLTLRRSYDLTLP